MRVYIVGTYLDYDESCPISIDKVFENKEEAKKYIDVNNACEESKDQFEKEVYDFMGDENGYEVKL